jgi:uncharacterized membrane protein YphA (DoxX/SURF4 family)
MNIILWILQVLLALQFLQHGWIMVFPPEEYVEIINETLGIGLRYFIGITELLAVVGIILPGLLRIHTWLVPLTSFGLFIISLCATVYHLIRDEISSAIYTAVLIVITAFVTFMRWKVKPILPKNKVEV